MESSDQNNKYRIRQFEYSKTLSGNERTIPRGVKLSILFGGVMQLISIIFIISGLTPFIPFIFLDMPSFGIVFMAIFPFIGVVMLSFGLRKSIKYLRIIKSGKLAYGTYLYNEPTNTKINNSTVYRYFFEFTDDKGIKYKTSGETHTGRLSDEPQELLVYNPNNPNEAVMVDALPKKVKAYILSLTDSGQNNNSFSDYGKISY
jgi:hypothetical protein